MRNAIYWVKENWPGRIAIVARPRGGDWLEDEIAAWADAGLDVIVSLLEEDEAAELGLSHEGELCRAAGLVFISFPVVDRSIPASQKAALALAEKLGKLLKQGKNIGIHCRQSVGRASLLAASILIGLGVEPHDALQRIGNARGCEVPETPQQLEWLLALTLQAAA
ncbi:MAG: tyrosine protein phosphatase [Acidobacteria bacterium]|nr:tyrosine protein phosphatase [Acidobacteriota bacterium]MBI3423461.1 tyrosine protein phosphatase [Acidobacteriota bacterium]